MAVTPEALALANHNYHANILRTAIDTKKEAVMNLNPRIARSVEVLTSEVDGEIVMMSIEEGTYSGLDAIGSAIWQ